MANIPSTASAAHNLFFRYPDAQFLLGPLENISFASVPSDLYYATDLVLHCNFCGNITWCLEPDVIDVILQMRFVKCVPSPDRPRCLPLAHQKWHLNIKFALFNVPTFLQPLLTVPTVYTLPMDPQEPLPSDEDTSTYLTLLDLDLSTLRGTAQHSFIIRSKFSSFISLNYLTMYAFLLFCLTIR